MSDSRKKRLRRRITELCECERLLKPRFAEDYGLTVRVELFEGGYVCAKCRRKIDAGSWVLGLPDVVVSPYLTDNLAWYLDDDSEDSL